MPEPTEDAKKRKHDPVHTDPCPPSQLRKQYVIDTPLTMNIVLKDT